MRPDPDQSPLPGVYCATLKGLLEEILIMDLSESQRQEIRAKIDELEEKLRDGAPVIPLIYGPEVVVHAWRVRNFHPGPLPFFAGVQLG